MQDSPPPFRCTAIIVAAGSSRRMGMDKLLWLLAGLPVLQRSIEAFASSPSIHSIIVVCPQDRWEILDLSDFSKPISRIDGGENRQDSVACGLAMLGDECTHVAVHDGARPLVSPNDIESCITAAITHGAATLARRVTETMKRSDSDDFCTDSINRENLWSMETPQIFEVSLLQKAYHSVISHGLVVTDEVSAVQSIGGKIKLIESKYPNLKITTPADLALAASLFSHSLS